MNKGTKPTNRFNLCQAGVVQCHHCGKLMPIEKKCSGCGEQIILSYYSKPLIPRAKMKEVPFSTTKEIRLNQ